MKGQNVQEYTTDFRKQAIALSVNMRDPETLEKYKGGLPFSIRTELALFPVTDIDDACKKAMYIEMKSQPYGARQSRNEGETVNTAHKEGTTYHVMSSKTNQYCENCKTDRHSKEGCWKLHPELKPAWWKDRKQTATTIYHKEESEEEEDEVIDRSPQPDHKTLMMTRKRVTTATAEKVTGSELAIPESVKSYFGCMLKSTRHRSLLYLIADHNKT